MKNIEKFFRDTFDCNSDYYLCKDIRKVMDKNFKCFDTNSDYNCETCSIKIKKWALEEYKESYKLTSVEYDTLCFWKQKGYDEIVKRNQKSLYLRKKGTKDWHRLRPISLYTDMFNFLSNKSLPIQKIIDNSTIEL